MLISRNWLQSYFATELPHAEDIAETLMMHAFELEGIEEKNNDSIIDIDVLPNRAHDCLSYAGVAHEYAALTKKELITDRYHYHDSVKHGEYTPDIAIDNSEQCYRYMARQISNIKVGDSPDWLKERLASIDQRSINNIVDATNYVMFDSGNPIHAFDSDKIVGGITVRNARDGEEMITLTGEELTLTEHDLVIADDEGVLALAGVKGGRKAEVDTNTKNIIIEVANFNPLTTRQTARRVKILTDSSKRFENGISSEIVSIALEHVSMLVSDVAHTDTTELSNIADIYPNPEVPVSITVSLEHIQKLLGCEISERDITDIFQRLDYQHHVSEGVFEVHIPAHRLDLRIPEDLIEEIGRIYGYHNIPIKQVDDLEFTPEFNALVYTKETLRNFLIEQGFSDVMTYSFVNKGDVELCNPIASDKKALRKTIHKQLAEALEINTRNSDYFGSDRTAIFEIGRIYTNEGEHTLCSIAVHNSNKSTTKKYGTERAQLESLVHEINSLLNVQLEPEYHGNTVSFNIDSLEVTSDYKGLFESSSYGEEARFYSISNYPYTTRDISFWAPEGKLEDELRTLITTAGAIYLKKVFLFDQFEKDERTSYAFSIVFQSDEKTLTDSEVDEDMNKIQDILVKNNCEIR